MIELAAGPYDTVVSGPFLLAAVLSLAAGAVSFASPCVLPLVPGYLSYVVGLVGGDTSEAGRGGAAVRVRTRAVGATSLFVVGFTVAFVAQFALVFGVSTWLFTNQELLIRIGGVIVVLVGVAMLGFIRPLQTERRFHARPGSGPVGAALLGLLFGVGWTACLGPTLTGVIALANATDWNGNAWRGLFLVLFYCAGLGLPFLALAFGFGWATTAVAFLRKHSRTIQVVGAVCLILIGLAMVTGVWEHFLAWLKVRFATSQVIL